MKFRAEIDVMPLKALLDPQGKTVASSLKNIGFSGIDNVRIGKHLTMELNAETLATAKKRVEKACKELLANPVMESYEYRITEL
jgi:phosphoribosylformylglycinamidine synthase subunit PurS